MPGGRHCAVATCKSSWKRKVNEDGKMIRFFHFPKDQSTRKLWIRKCKLSHFIAKDSPQSTVRSTITQWNRQSVCGLHFRADDFEDELKARIMNTIPSRLKKNVYHWINKKKCTAYEDIAVPSLNLPPSSLFENESTLSFASGAGPSPRTQRLEQKERKELVQEILEKCKEQDDIVIKKELAFEDSEDDDEQQDFFVTDELAEGSNMKKLKEENALLKGRLLLHEQKIADLQKQLNMATKKHEDFKEAIKSFLSQTQLDLVLKKKTKGLWTKDELLKALTLYRYSKQCYAYLKNTLHYPLPGISTLLEWTKKVKLEETAGSEPLRTAKEDSEPTKILIVKGSCRTIDSEMEEEEDLPTYQEIISNCTLPQVIKTHF